MVIFGIAIWVSRFTQIISCSIPRGYSPSIHQYIKVYIPSPIPLVFIIYLLVYSTMFVGLRPQWAI